jgi:hypothetical protein
MNNISLTSANSITLPNINAASILAQTTSAAADITIGVGRILSASGAGDAITLAAGRNIINNAGAGALSAASGRWLLYSTNPTDTTGEELLASDFNRYNCTYTACNAGVTIPATGNGLIYSFVPSQIGSNYSADVSVSNVTPAVELKPQSPAIIISKPIVNDAVIKPNIIAKAPTTPINVAIPNTVQINSQLGLPVYGLTTNSAQPKTFENRPPLYLNEDNSVVTSNDNVSNNSNQSDEAKSNEKQQEQNLADNKINQTQQNLSVMNGLLKIHPKLQQLFSIKKL